MQILEPRMKISELVLSATLSTFNDSKIKVQPAGENKISFVVDNRVVAKLDVKARDTLNFIELNVTENELAKKFSTEIGAILDIIKINIKSNYPEIEIDQRIFYDNRLDLEGESALEQLNKSALTKFQSTHEEVSRQVLEILKEGYGNSFVRVNIDNKNKYVFTVGRAGEDDLLEVQVVRKGIFWKRIEVTVTDLGHGYPSNIKDGVFRDLSVMVGNFEPNNVSLEVKNSHELNGKFQEPMLQDSTRRIISAYVQAIEQEQKPTVLRCEGLIRVLRNNKPQELAISLVESLYMLADKGVRSPHDKYKKAIDKILLELEELPSGLVLNNIRNLTERLKQTDITELHKNTTFNDRTSYFSYGKGTNEYKKAKEMSTGGAIDRSRFANKELIDATSFAFSAEDGSFLSIHGKTGLQFASIQFLEDVMVSIFDTSARLKAKVV